METYLTVSLGPCNRFVPVQCLPALYVMVSVKIALWGGVDPGLGRTGWGLSDFYYKVV